VLIANAAPSARTSAFFCILESPPGVVRGLFLDMERFSLLHMAMRVTLLRAPPDVKKKATGSG